MDQSSPHIASEKTPVGSTQRTISAIAGSLLLYMVGRKHPKETVLMLGGSYLLYRGLTGRCPVTEALKGSGHPGHARNVNVRTSMVVSKPREEVYAIWRRLENLPLFMRHLESVDEIDRNRSAWKIHVPGGVGELRWEAAIVREDPGVALAWQSVSGAPIENSGKLFFSDTAGRATRIDVNISYKAPLGVVGERIARMLTPVFRNMIEKDILGFKRFVEDQEDDDEIYG